MWWFLGIVVATQLYFVRELLAAFALFALVFAVIGGFIASAYMLHKAWEAGVIRVVRSSNPVVLAAKRGTAAIEELSRRPFRRPNSETAA